MKIAYGSDLHLEFGMFYPENKEGAHVLVLAGDICNGDVVPKHFFGACEEEFEHVIYIMGNHEHYFGDFLKTKEMLKDRLSFSRVKILDYETVNINGIYFHGGTFWTDFDKGDPWTLWAMRKYMNDFVNIQYDGRRRFTPEDAYADHKKGIEFLKNAFVPGQRNIVVAHHAPSTQSIHPMYRGEQITNHAYVSDLSYLFEEYPFDIWFHGHTHTPHDYQFFKSRVLCNPRGYVGYEKAAREFDFKYVEI